VPIFVARTVMDAAGITPETDLHEEHPAPPEEKSPPPPAGGEEDSSRLSIFEDFLGKLDLGDLDKEDPEDDDKK
jgi:hypothetical protein